MPSVYAAFAVLVWSTIAGMFSDTRAFSCGGGRPLLGGSGCPPCNVSPFSSAEALNLTWCYVSAVLSQVPRPTTSEAPIAEASCIRTTSTRGSHLLGHLLHSLFQFGKAVISGANVDLIHWICCLLVDQQEFSCFRYGLEIILLG